MPILLLLALTCCKPLDGANDGGMGKNQLDAARQAGMEAASVPSDLTLGRWAKVASACRSDAITITQQRTINGVVYLAQARGLACLMMAGPIEIDGTQQYKAACLNATDAQPFYGAQLDNNNPSALVLAVGKPPANVEDRRTVSLKRCPD